MWLRGLFSSDAILGTIGDRCIGLFKKVLLLQRELTYSPSKAKINELQTKLTTLVSPTFAQQMRDNQATYKSSPLVSKAEWDTTLAALHNEQTNPEDVSYLKIIYGRILHVVHGGDIKGASQCAMSDCHEIVVGFLPDLITRISRLKETLDHLSSIQQQMDDIQQEIIIMHTQE